MVPERNLKTVALESNESNVRQARVKCHPAFRGLYTAVKDGIEFIIAIGSRGGMKTYEVSKFSAYDAVVRKRRQAILRDEASTIKESILNEIKARYATANSSGFFDSEFEVQDFGIKNKVTNQMQVFTRGFRASSNEKKANLKGMSEVDTAIVEEAEDIRSFEKFSTFKDTIRTDKRLIIVILNTPDIQHWIVKRYFNLEHVESVTLTNGEVRKVDGYWRLVPKKVDGFMCIQTTYKDNLWLSEAVKRDYDSYGDPNHPNFDLHYYLTAMLGLASSGRKGQIYTKVKPIKLADYIKLPYKEVFGLDFGTNAPAALVGAKFNGNNMYARQLFFKPMPVLEIGKFLCEYEFDDNDLIIADSAEPGNIRKLRDGWEREELIQEITNGENIDELIRKYPGLLKGFNVRSCVKFPGSVRSGISLMTSMVQHVCEESTDMWDEIYNYIYAVNKEGEPTNEPIDAFNHALDAWRYIGEARGRHF